MLVAVGGHIALPFAQRNLHRELGARIQRGDVHTRVEYLNLRIAFDASGGHFTLALGLYSHRLGFIAIQLCGKPLDVEDNLSYVFFHSRDCREFVLDAVDLHRDDRNTRKRGKQHTAQGIPQRGTKTSVQRFRHKFAVTTVRLELDRLNLGLYDFDHNGPSFSGGNSIPALSFSFP